MTRLRLVRLAAVLAVASGTLLSSGVAGAQVGPGCDGTVYDPADPDHVLYGRSAGTMHVDLTGRTPVGDGFVVFWDGRFVSGAKGAVIIGSSYRDLICGTTGDDWVWGKRGGDTILGFGSESDYDRSIGGGRALGDHLFGGRGNDVISNGDGIGLSALSSAAALVGGGRGNDTLYLGDGSSGTPWARGGVGDDKLMGGLGGSGHTLAGGAGSDSIDLWGLDGSSGYGNGGDDHLTSQWGDTNVLHGDNGDDSLEAGWGSNLRLDGGAGNDTLKASTGANTVLLGGPGDDVMSNVGAGIGQVADGGTGEDTVHRSRYPAVPEPGTGR